MDDNLTCGHWECDVGRVRGSNAVVSGINSGMVRDVSSSNKGLAGSSQVSWYDNKVPGLYNWLVLSSTSSPLSPEKQFHNNISKTSLVMF